MAYKPKAMTLAARHQLGDKHAVTVAAATQVDWDDLARRGSMVTKGCALEELIRVTDVSESRMKELAAGQDPEVIEVELKVGTRLKDED